MRQSPISASSSSSESCANRSALSFVCMKDVVAQPGKQPSAQVIDQAGQRKTGQVEVPGPGTPVRAFVRRVTSDKVSPQNLSGQEETPGPRPSLQARSATWPLRGLPRRSRACQPTDSSSGHRQDAPSIDKSGSIAPDGSKNRVPSGGSFLPTRSDTSHFVFVSGMQEITPATRHRLAPPPARSSANDRPAQRLAQARRTRPTRR